MPEGRTKRLASLALALALALAGCGTTRTETRVEPATQGAGEAAPHEERVETTPAEPVSTEAGRRLLDEAAEADRRGDRVASRRVLERLVRERPETVEAARARLRLAEEAVDRRDWAAAEVWVGREAAWEAVDGAPFRRHRVLALAWEGQERYREAADAWLAASEAAPGEPERRDAVTRAAGDLTLSGEARAARETLVERGVPPDALRRHLEERLHGPLLERAAARVAPMDPLAPWLQLRFARARCGAGDLTGCREAAEGALRSPDEEIVVEAEALLERVEAWDQVAPRRVGVLLPLSGPYQRIGQAALEGIQLALDGAAVDLVVRDTAGDADQAAAQVESLVLEEHVVALLGPVGEKESRAAAEAAQALGVPQVVLTSSRQAVADLPVAHRVRLSAEEQASALARYVVTALEVGRVAILFPEEAAGVRVMGAFWDEVVRLGGEVRAVERYGPETNDFSPVLRDLLGARKPGDGTFDFEALFVPDDALTVRRLVPFLKYWDLRIRTTPGERGTKSRPAVQLLGAAGWNHPSVIDRGDNLTDNAIFVDAWVHDPDDAAADRFARTFYARYSRKPTPFHAEVRDATALLLEAVEGLEATTHQARLDALTALRGTRHLRGVTGDIAVLETGEVVRRPRLLTIDLDTIRPRLSEEEEEAVRRRDAPVLHPAR